MHDPPTLTWLSSCFPETESSLPVGASTNPRNPTLRTASASLARSDETPQPLKIARLLCGCWVAAYGMKTTMMIDESRACMLRALPKWDGGFAAALPPQGRTALMPLSNSICRQEFTIPDHAFIFTFIFLSLSLFFFLSSHEIIISSRGMRRADGIHTIG